jgi:hypothetical protein
MISRCDNYDLLSFIPAKHSCMLRQLIPTEKHTTSLYYSRTEAEQSLSPNQFNFFRRRASCVPSPVTLLISHLPSSHYVHRSIFLALRSDKLFWQIMRADCKRGRRATPWEARPEPENCTLWSYDHQIWVGSTQSTIPLFLVAIASYDLIWSTLSLILGSSICALSFSFVLRIWI